MSETTKVGFVGQGWVGKNIADEFESRQSYVYIPKFEVIRYALEEPYCHNAHLLLDCEFVFVAVPTATDEYGHDLSNVRSALNLLAPGTTTIIKSTIKPGTTFKLQSEFPDLIVIHNPEFLTEAHVYRDTRYPKRNIIGIPMNEEPWILTAHQVMHLLPKAPYELITDSLNAELIKYAGNAFLLTKVVFTNILYDLVKAHGGDWNEVRDGWINDYRVGESHTKVFDKDGKRGAAGHCLLKDFEVFENMMRLHPRMSHMHAKFVDVIKSVNRHYLWATDKDQDIVKSVYPNSLTRQKSSAK